MATLIEGIRYDIDGIRWVGWEDADGRDIDPEGYQVAHYFDADDTYLGPDADGIEPTYEETHHTEHKVLATIDLDRDEGRGELYYCDGDIWCHRAADGRCWPTNTGCDSEADAPGVILASWGAPKSPWDLQWIDD